VVCARGFEPDTGIAFGLILELTRRSAGTRAHEIRRALAGHARHSSREDARRLASASSATRRRRGKAFAEVIVLEPELDAGTLQRGRRRIFSKDDLFRNADVVTVHLVLATHPRKLVGEASSLVKKRLIVNTSAAIIDEKALLDALTRSRSPAPD